MKKVKEKFFPDRIATADIGRDRVFFLGRDPLSVAIGFLSGSRPMVGRDRNFLVGRDRVYFLDRNPLSVATHQKIPVPNTNCIAFDGEHHIFILRSNSCFNFKIVFGVCK
jgi:hypothetical protein